MNIDTRKLGTILLVAGVLAWVPFLLLLAFGREPSIYPFLAVHLVGVVGGSRLRALTGQRRSRRQVWGRILIILGVFAWAPWFYQTDLLGRELQIAPYLTLHLTGVLGGLALLLSGPLQRFWQNTRSSAPQSSLLSHPESE